MDNNNENHINMLPTNTEKPKYQQYYRIVPIFIITLFIIYTISLVITLRSVFLLSKTGKENITEAISNAKSFDFVQSQNQLREAQTNFKYAKVKLSKITFAKIIPQFKRKINTGINLLASAQSLSSALEKGAIIATDISKAIGEKTSSYNELKTKQKYLILKELQNSKETLKSIKNDVDQANITLTAVTKKDIGDNIYKYLYPIQKLLPEIQNGLSIIIPTVDILPKVLGFENPQTYLFVLQNDMELRPGGGLASTYGIIRLKDGSLEQFEAFDTYELDKNALPRLKEPSPLAIQRYIGRKKLVMRDSNWSVDFPTTARIIQTSYYREADTPPVFAGVIATTPTIFADLLEILGNVVIDDKIITPQNIRTIFHTDVRAKSSKNPEQTIRKNLFNNVADELLSGLEKIPFVKYVTLLSYSQKWLTQKDLQLFSYNDKIQDLILNENWGGEIQNSPADYIFVVDANVGNLEKIDKEINREISYTITPEKDKIRAYLEITYTNNSNLSGDISTDYHTFTRIYLPKNITIIQTKGFTDEVNTSTEFDKTILSGYHITPTTETKSISIEYYLSKKIAKQINEKKDYSLYIQKQPGNDSNITITANFNNPIFEFVPKNIHLKIRNNSQLVYKAPLQKDLMIKATLK